MASNNTIMKGWGIENKQGELFSHFGDSQQEAIKLITTETAMTWEQLQSLGIKAVRVQMMKAGAK